MGAVYYLAFGYSDRWFNKYLSGFTHVALIMPGKDFNVQLEPLLHSCFVDVGRDLDFSKWDKVLKVTVIPTRANRLIGLRWQTCATFVQYVMGISTGAILAQTLYDRLLKRQYKGVEVSICDLKTLNLKPNAKKHAITIST